VVEKTSAIDKIYYNISNIFYISKSKPAMKVICPVVYFNHSYKPFNNYYNPHLNPSIYVN